MKKLIVKFIRWSLGRLILLLNAVFSPRSMKRTAELQKQIDEQTRYLSLYQYNACPFCVKVRRAIKRLNLNIEIRDAKTDQNSRDELIREGGALKVPCLRVVNEEGQVQWMYESSDIVNYLQSRFAA